MATRSGPNRLRRPALRGGLVVDTVRGAVRVRIWPKKRGRPTHPATLQQNAWFSEVCQTLKYVDGRAMDWAIRATKQTGLYPRDLLTRCMSKGLFIIHDPDKGMLRPQPQGVWSVMFQGCRIEKTADQGVGSNTQTTMLWQTAIFDTAGFFNPSDPTKLTIPEGVNIVNATFSTFNNSGSNVQTQLIVMKNGTDQVAYLRDQSAGRSPGPLVSGPLPVDAGDELTFVIVYSSARTVLADIRTYACLEVLDASLNP